MRRKSEKPGATPERVVKDIRRKTRKRHSTEENIRIVLEGLSDVSASRKDFGV